MDGTPTASSVDVAAFDFDGTISKRDTLMGFLIKASGPARFLSAWARLGVLGARRRLPMGDRDRIKEQMIGLLLGGRSERELRELGDLYARDLLTGDRLRPEVVERVHEHRRAGHRTVIVSASLVYYLDPIAAALSMDDVIGVEPEVLDGRLTGRLRRPNVRGEQKALRLQEWMDASRGEPGSVDVGDRGLVHGYGNTSGDHRLLEMADRSWWLGRPSKLPQGVTIFRPGAPLD